MPERAAGVLYALGGFSGGLTLFMDSGFLVYEYNMLIIERFQARSFAPITPGEHVITVDTRFESPQPMAPAAVTLTVDGNEVGKVVVARTVPAAFTASETFGVGVDLGSPVSPDYVDRRPFRFTGTIDTVDIEVFAPGSGQPAGGHQPSPAGSRPKSQCVSVCGPAAMPGAVGKAEDKGGDQVEQDGGGEALVGIVGGRDR